MAVNEECRIVSHGDAAPGYRMLVLSAPQIAAAVVPGQFVHVKVPGLEASAVRRPFSVFDGDPSAGTVTVLYKIVGRGTEALAQEPDNAAYLEMVAKLALDTLALEAACQPADRCLQDKHFLRKHGPNAYYGQAKH